MSAETMPSLPLEIQQLSFLVAEGNTTLQKTIVATLSAAGIKNCGAVGNGADAWQAWKQKREIGVIISAWNLTEMAGMEILKRIRADTMAKIQPAFLIMAPENAADSVQEAVEAGADCYLAKPFSADHLIPMVIEAVQHRKQIGRDSAFLESALESSILGSHITGELVFERYNTTVEVDELSKEKCVFRSEMNYGLGTPLALRLARNRPGADPYYIPLKGTVTKMERVPKEFGWFRIHLQFTGRIKEQHGVTELLERISSAGGGE